ncbi:DEAD/DEAH box helicase [Candidatus Pacearchaeota archaeon]|nr:DEAD/DEAH box helicase [Candidatus Pacearchaeota archaeon]
MLAKEAVQQYLARELDSHDWLKKISREELLSQFDFFNPVPIFESPLPHWKHQLACLFISLCLDEFLCFMDIGSGKTRVGLENFAYRRLADGVKKGLVLTLSDAVCYEWEDNAKEHTPSVDVVSLIGSSEEKRELLHTSTDICACSYAGFRALVSSKKPGGGLAIDLRKVREIQNLIDWVGYDEIHECKNKETLNFRTSWQITRSVSYRLGLTGTPFNRDPIVLWSIFKLIDKGLTLGPNIGLFRDAFFIKKIGWTGFPEYVFDRRKKRKLHKVIKHRSISYEDKEIGDMPKRRRTVIKLRSEGLQNKMHRELWTDVCKKAIAHELSDPVWMKLRMIASGFVTLRNEDSNKVEIEFENNPKIEALQDYVHKLNIDEKVIIVNEFTYSGIIIRRTLVEMGYKPLLLKGGMQKTSREVLRKFKHDPKYRFLILNWKVGGGGLNFPACSHMVFWESPSSALSRKQTEGRIRRKNSICRYSYYTDFVIRNSVEEKILKYIREGRDLHSELVAGRFKARVQING